MASNSKGLGEENIHLGDTSVNAVASAVFKTDEQKVKAHQKDIDTLLLVAGLFSAVLTPLLVESYHLLRQDSAETMVLLLRQIARQTDSFTLNNNFVNATSTVPIDSQPFDFTPTLNARRVNVLWFTSLVLSLTTATFCINVKRWLTEYLLQEYIQPPTVRLQIRIVCYRSLTDWSVLEIATVLSLLLQVSITLFLVGLCFFTFDIYKEVGHTTIPLMIAWRILSSLYILMPILWFRCPYQTPYLRILPFMNRARNHEEEAAQDETNDIKIFGDLDAVQSDDQFLLGPIWKALLSMPRNPNDLVKFVISAIQRRIPFVKMERLQVLPVPLDLSDLRDQSYIKLMQMVADIIQIEFDHYKGTPQKNVAWIID